MPDSAPADSGARSEWTSGWRLLVAAHVGAMLTSVPMNTVGVFMPSLSAEFGWSHGAIAGAVPLVGWTLGLTAPFMGRWLDLKGARRFGICGALFLPIALGLLAFVGPSILSYWLGWAGVALAAVCAGLLVWTVPVARHFHVHRGAALAVVLAGTSTTGIVFPPLIRLVIDGWGWRTAYLATGAASLLIVLPTILVWFRQPAAEAPGRPDRTATEAATEHGSGPERGSGLSLGECLRTPRFWQLAGAVALSAAPGVGLYIHIVPIARALAMNSATAAAAASMVAVGAMLAKLVIGLTIDRLRAAPVAALTMLGPIGACLMLALVEPLPPAGVLGAAMMLGFATGAESDVIGVLIGRYFGMRHFGRIFGVLLGTFLMANGIGPLLLGISFDLLGGYRTGILACASLLGVAGALFLTLGAEPWPHRQRGAHA